MLYFDEKISHGHEMYFWEQSGAQPEKQTVDNKNV